MDRPCIGGCGVLVKGWTYCPRCRCRLRDGTPLDLESYPAAALGGHGHGTRGTDRLCGGKR